MFDGDATAPRCVAGIWHGASCREYHVDFNIVTTRSKEKFSGTMLIVRGPMSMDRVCDAGRNFPGMHKPIIISFTS